MVTLLACVTGVILDWIFGDPYWLYHPIRLIGVWISFLEKLLRKMMGTTKRGQFFAGVILWVLIAGVSTLVPLALLETADKIHPVLRFLLECFWCYQLLAAHSLSCESRKVYYCLKQKDIEGARKAVSMIVGRDTCSLTETGITKAAVETVAENTSDGVIAPLLFLLLGGAPLGFFYKAVNTMDSMLGYKNEQYLYFGRAAARLDDIMNYFPARISAVLMMVTAFLTGMDGKNAWKIYRRDRKKHASPNAAQTESVCAGALDIQLAGDAYYFGVLHKKEFIGDAIRQVEAEDICRAGKLMYGTEILTLLIFGGMCLIAVLM